MPQFQLGLTGRSEQLALLAAGAGVGAAVAFLLSRRAPAGAAAAAAAADANVSTTSSGHSGAVYETRKAVAEYLMFHFGADADVLPYAEGPRAALGFASRTAALCVEHARAAGLPLEAAFDVGCAVGRTSFDLSASFDRVVGLDHSAAFVGAANALKAAGAAPFTMAVEGERTSEHVATLPPAARAERCTFVQGDACALPPAAALGGPFTLVHAANLLCRLPDPAAFLDALPRLLVRRGLVVLVSPFSWLAAYTPRERWLGGRAGGPASRDALAARMAALGFELRHEGECPFLIREHARKFQWGCSNVSVWQLKE